MSTKVCLSGIISTYIRVAVVVRAVGVGIVVRVGV